MATYKEVNQYVLDMANEIIREWHRDLLNAKIGFIFQEAASTKLGKVVLGNASKVSDKQRAAGLDLDYIITLAFDWWVTLDTNQKRALIDHELCHCDFADGSAKMRGHDIEEFQCIIDRYGLWRSDLAKIAPSFANAQMSFEIPAQGQGELVAISPAILAED